MAVEELLRDTMTTHTGRRYVTEKNFAKYSYMPHLGARSRHEMDSCIGYLWQ